MGQVLIRNLDDNLIETYKTKARLKGKSLEQELRDVLERNAPFTREERVALTKQFHAHFKAPVTPLTKDEIREGFGAVDVFIDIR